jgi:hypothetical protein
VANHKLFFELFNFPQLQDVPLQVQGMDPGDTMFFHFSGVTLQLQTLHMSYAEGAGVQLPHVE